MQLFHKSVLISPSCWCSLAVQMKWWQNGLILQLFKAVPVSVKLVEIPIWKFSQGLLSPLCTRIIIFYMVLLFLSLCFSLKWVLLIMFQKTVVFGNRFQLWRRETFYLPNFTQFRKGPNIWKTLCIKQFHLGSFIRELAAVLGISESVCFLWWHLTYKSDALLISSSSASFMNKPH